MPKVKKKSEPRKAAGSRKTTKSRKKKQVRFGEVWIDTIKALLGRFTTVVAAGITAVALIGAVFLWSGGYFGLLAERINQMVDASTAAAGFEVRRITVRGASETGEAELLSAIGPVIGSSLIHFDAYAARARVEDIGWVRTAAVSRLLPNTIHISVREREPAAVWQMSGTLHLVDQTGAVIREIDAYEYSNLPLIVGAGAPSSASELLKALRAESALWGAASALIRVGDRRWNLRLKSGADVKFPETNVGRAVRDLAKLQTVYAILDRPLEYIDLRDVNHLIYREKDAIEVEFTLNRMTAQ